MACEPRSGGSGALLDANDPSPVAIVNPAGTSPVLFIGDHAGNRIPAALGTLGLAQAQRVRHIAWDIGVRALGEALAARLDAMFVHQVYSRLVIDCNRDPQRVDAVPPVSDETAIPGNAALSAADRARRVEAIHEPYQRAIGDELARRREAGRPGVLVSLHSFTPAMRGRARPWQVGVLHDRGETGLAHAALRWLRADGRWTVGDNEPYQMDNTDHTVPRHAYPVSLPYIEFEIRQDLIDDAAGQQGWADDLAALLTAVVGPVER